MTARRWFAIAALTLMTAAGACTGNSPTGLQDDDGRAMPPVAPNDTSGFVPEGGMG